MKITTNHCSQWRRYSTRYGTLCIRRDNRKNVAIIPAAVPHVSIPITRAEAASGLRVWRTAN